MHTRLASLPILNWFMESGARIAHSLRQNNNLRVRLTDFPQPTKSSHAKKSNQFHLRANTTSKCTILNRINKFVKSSMARDYYSLMKFPWFFFISRFVSLIKYYCASSSTSSAQSDDNWYQLIVYSAIKRHQELSLVQAAPSDTNSRVWAHAINTKARRIIESKKRIQQSVFSLFGWHFDSFPNCEPIKFFELKIGNKFWAERTKKKCVHHVYDTIPSRQHIDLIDEWCVDIIGTEKTSETRMLAFWLLVLLCDRFFRSRVSFGFFSLPLLLHEFWFSFQSNDLRMRSIACGATLFCFQLRR